ncbi:MAG TPA: carboxypeptidase regulatory-like domain-containing protein [Vicinamibacterales bacterium]|nr:carboxypeptidase regulatory-like domain-containing protein [Vicinamibacterales bacterium]
MRMRILSLAFTIAGVLFAAPAFAQNAQISGTLKDQSGGVLPGAIVTARNLATGLTRSAVTEAAGEYRVPALPPGSYSVTAEMQGFSTEKRPEIVLVIDQDAVINFTLKPAAVSEELTVTAESPIVDTTKSDVSTSVSTIQIQDLPVASRRWIDLAMLTPGTSQDNIRGFFYRGNVNIGGGTREYSNGFVVDGVNNTWAEMGEPRQNFAMDAIQEFKVSTSNYKAEYGLATGGLLTVVTKSGTNQIHGSGLMFVRDSRITAEEYPQKQLDAAQKVPEGTNEPKYHRYQYGGTVGGPIVQNKTHFFFAYEGTKEQQNFTINTNGIWPQYQGVFPSKQTRWTYNTKIDHQLSASQSVFFRFGAEDEYRPIITTGGRTTPSASFDFGVPRQSAVGSHTWIIGPRSLNDVRFQYAYSKYQVAPPYSHGDWEPGDFTERIKLCTPVFSYPAVIIGGCGNAQMGPEHRYQIKDDLSHLMQGWGGSHQWKIGMDYSYIPFQGDLTNSPFGSWTFPKDAVYNANDTSTWPTNYSESLPTYADIPTHTFATYLQDDWKARDGLTFNLGLRYDLQKGSFNEDIPGLLGKIQDKLGRNGTFPVDPSVIAQPKSGRGDFNNFGPRVGVAWDPQRNGVMNIHAGYGMFYDNMRTLQNFGELTWPQAQAVTINRPSFPDPYQGASRSQFVSTAPPNISVMSNATVNPYAHQFNVGVNRIVMRQFAVTADWSFINRYSDRDTVDPNIPNQTTRVKLYPQFNRVSFWQSTADNTYRALLVKVEKRMSHHYQFLTSYTLSYAKDQNFVNSLGDRYGYYNVDRYGTADRRHRLVVSGIVQLPGQAQVSAIGDFRSSLPFSPSSALGDLNNDGYTGDLPAGVLPGSGCRGLNLDTINAIRASRNLTAVTQVDCPGFANVDLRFSKFFSLAAGHQVEFIAQLFNVFNRANFATPNGSITAANDLKGRPLFGQSQSLLANINAPSRQAEFAVRWKF